MSRRVSIVMYHYVRELKASRYPGIKGLELQKFRGQLEYLRRFYTIVRMEDVLAALAGGPLPPNAALLTFDDAYVDHYLNVFPILDAQGLQGSFFPPAKTVLHNKVLDVNKIHFILASVSDHSVLVGEIFAMVDEARAEHGLASNAEYYVKLAQANRFDPAEAIFIKRMLQRELPEALRSAMTDRLFRKYVSADEGAFAKELYLSLDQIRCMKRSGMFIGSHSFDHYWLNALSPEAQREQVSLSRDFLDLIGCDRDNWVMCYPYGAYDDSLAGILRESGCKVGLTTKVAVADLDADSALTLPRLDTNDLPCEKDALPNEWTRRALAEPVGA